MKTHLILALCLAIASAARAQIPGPEPPTQGSWHNVRLARQLLRLRQPAPMPAGGCWIVEDRITTKGSTIIRYYDQHQREIWADTLLHKHLILSRKSDIDQLNSRLNQLLDARASQRLSMHYR